MMVAMRILGACAPLMCAGCSVISAPTCTDQYVYAVSVSVVDSATGAMAASGAQLVAREGVFADSMSLPANRADLDAFSLHAAGERAGTYAVTIQKSGYRDWTRTNVQVAKDACHVTTVSLTALMQRS
jgi:hypothetical protein